MTVTLSEIAQIAGVSISTVSRALTNNNHPLKAETRQRIVNLATEMGYKPNLVARSLQSNRTHTVGVIVDRMTSPFAAATVQGIQDGLRQAGYSISIINSNRDQELVVEAVQTFYSRRVDGIIILNSWLHTFNDPLLSLQDRPFVFVNRLFSDAIHNCVAPGDRCGAQLAVKHLVDLGHRRIAYINGIENWLEAQNRLAGYRDILTEQGLAVDEALIRPGNWGVDSGYRAAQELLRLKNRPTAIFAANDLMALGAIYALQEAGLSVPDDVALVGYDDRDFAAWIKPALTTIRMPSYEMGQAAARLLLEQFAGETSEDATQIPGDLIVRQSCGAGTKRDQA
jgi:LacI family transcriptional regulator